jgi:hypothetical protein
MQQGKRGIQGDKSVLATVWPPHGLSWDRTGALTVRRLTDTAVVMWEEKHDASQIRVSATVSVPPNN